MSTSSRRHPSQSASGCVDSSGSANTFPRNGLRAGRHGAHVALIREGLVKLVLYSPAGTERIVRLAMPGDTVGLELMLGGHFHHTAVALTEVELCQMPLAVVDERFTHAPASRKKCSLNGTRRSTMPNDF